MATARKAAADAAFQKGDRVCWSHMFAVMHPPESVIWASAVEALAPDGKLGTVKGLGNEEATWFEVLIDGEKQPRTLTQDELVKVNDDA